MRLFWIVLFASFITFTSIYSQSKEDPRLEWWKQARYGMFIHWGPVSLKGTEIGWSRGREVPIEEYDQLYKKFNPENFSARSLHPYKYSNKLCSPKTQPP